MKKSKCILLFAILFFNVGVSFAEEYTLIEKTVETSYYKNLDVKTVMGDISVSSWEKPLINVAIKGNMNAIKCIEYTVDITDGNLIVTTTKKNDVSVSGDVYLKIEITVPKFYHISLKTSSGDIKIRTITGTVKVETSGGNISVNEHTGDSELKTAGGNIKDVNFRGGVNATTAGGDIVLDGIEGEIKAITAGGNIKAQYSGTNNGITLKTNGGDIKLTIPELFKATLDISNTGGEIVSDFSVLINKELNLQTQKGDINGGGKTVLCSTMGGKVTIGK